MASQSQKNIMGALTFSFFLTLPLDAELEELGLQEHGRRIREKVKEVRQLWPVNEKDTSEIASCVVQFRDAVMRDGVQYPQLLNFSIALIGDVIMHFQNAGKLQKWEAFSELSGMVEDLYEEIDPELERQEDIERGSALWEVWDLFLHGTTVKRAFRVKRETS